MFASMGSSVPCKLPWVHRPIRQRKKRREGRQRKDGPAAAAGGGDLMRWNLVSCHGAHMESSMSRLQRCSRPYNPTPNTFEMEVVGALQIVSDDTCSPAAGW